MVKCPKCGRSKVRLRRDGKIALHDIPRAYRSQKMRLDRCPAGGTSPEQWSAGSVCDAQEKPDDG